MKKTPWVLLVANIGILVLLAWLNWVSKVPVEEELPHLTRDIVDAVQPRVWTWILVITAVGIGLQGIERLINIFGFKQGKAKSILNQVVKDLLQNDAKHHRCTLFRARRGWRVWLHLIPRIPSQDDHWDVIRDLMRVRPWGLYLYVYARAEKAPNERSCAVYRVYQTKNRDCEGVAGLAWMRDYVTLRYLDAPDTGDFKKTLRGKKKISDLGSASKVGRYAKSTNVSNPLQLRARQRAAKHYVGSVIETRSGIKWGVLLVDSVHDSCPFPVDSEGQRFREEYQRYAQVLSIMLT